MIVKPVYCKGCGKEMVVFDLGTLIYDRPVTCDVYREKAKLEQQPASHPS